MADKKKEIASLKAAIKALLNGPDSATEENEPPNKRPRMEASSSQTGQPGYTTMVDSRSTTFTRSKRTTNGVLKRENMIDGVHMCPVCNKNIPVANGGCNIIACRNHSPQFVYFFIHCKKVNNNGVEYATCDCPARNTKETRVEAQKMRNEKLRANPIVI